MQTAEHQHAASKHLSESRAELPDVPGSSQLPRLAAQGNVRTYARTIRSPQTQRTAGQPRVASTPETASPIA